MLYIYNSVHVPVGVGSLGTGLGLLLRAQEAEENGSRGALRGVQLGHQLRARGLGLGGASGGSAADGASLGLACIVRVEVEVGEGFMGCTGGELGKPYERGSDRFQS